MRTPILAAVALRSSSACRRSARGTRAPGLALKWLEVQAALLPDADDARMKAMLEKKPIAMINHRKAAERLLMR